MMQLDVGNNRSVYYSAMGGYNVLERKEKAGQRAVNLASDPIVIPIARVGDRLWVEGISFR